MELEIENLSKQFGETWALREVDATFTPGIVGLLGPNGAGKSTLMRIVTTLLDPSEGAVYWNGTDIANKPGVVRNAVGYLPQDFGVYPNLTAEEFLSYLADIRGLSDTSDRIDDLLALVNLGDARDQRLGGFSGGMRQRVGIAQVLLGDPDLLVVDEPTVGLDPEERVRFRNVLAELAEDRIVVLSTHIVSDVEATATDIALLHEGRIHVHDRPGALLDRAAGAVWEWIVPDEDLAGVRQTHTVSGTARRQNGVQVRVITESAPSAEAESVEPTLEDAYLHALGEGARR